MDGRKTLNKYMKRVENVRLWKIIWNKVKGKGSARIREGAAFAILRRSSKSTPHTLWKDWYWSWSSSILVTWWEQPVHWESPWCWGRLRVEGEEGIRDEMVGWHHRRNGHELGQTPGDGEGQGALVCCSPGGRKESDTTGWLDNNNSKKAAPRRWTWAKKQTTQSGRRALRLREEHCRDLRQKEVGDVWENREGSTCEEVRGRRHAQKDREHSSDSRGTRAGWEWETHRGSCQRANSFHLVF